MRLPRYAFLFGLAAAVAAAQESPSPSPSPAATPVPPVRIEFVPPPMDGVVSLGIYDAAGKLVRVLHREAPLSEFKVGVNGLITGWDGRDDSGAQAPAGKYSGRGFMVGEFFVEGEAFLFNDWVSEEGSFRPSRILGIRALPDGDLTLTARTAEGIVPFRCGKAGKIVPGKDPAAAAIVPAETPPPIPATIALSGSSKAIDSSVGSDGNLWVIVRDGAAVDVREYTPAGEFVRRLPIKQDDPLPVKISATGPPDEIFLLEENDREQRVLGLTLDQAQPPAAPGEPGISIWKINLSKSIIFSDPIDKVRDRLKSPDGKPFTPQEKIKVALVPNPLDPDRHASLAAGVAIDKQGSFLRLADGLPLRHLTETPGLRWAVIASGDGISLFQGDGAVVEEFKVGGLEKMMAFDCGSFDYAPAKQAP